MPSFKKVRKITRKIEVSNEESFKTLKKKKRIFENFRSGYHPRTSKKKKKDSTKKQNCFETKTQSQKSHQRNRYLGIPPPCKIHKTVLKIDKGVELIYLNQRKRPSTKCLQRQIPCNKEKKKNENSPVLKTRPWV